MVLFANTGSNPCNTWTQWKNSRKISRKRADVTVFVIIQNVKVLEYISAADWVEHREECERNTTEKSKGKVLEADERSTTFIENHTSYLLKTRNFTQMALAYQMANPRTPSHMIVADPDYTNSPPTLSVKSALKCTGYDNFENIITDASENPGEGQVAHISVPFIHGKPERILTILYEDFVD